MSMAPHLCPKMYKLIVERTRVQKSDEYKIRYQKDLRPLNKFCSTGTVVVERTFVRSLVVGGIVY
jgi:hypothetical protein